MATITVTVGHDNQTYELGSRLARIVGWLMEESKVLNNSDKGQIRIDYYGDDLVMRNTQIKEHRKRR